MGEDDRRRDERGANAHDAHPQRRGSHPNKVSGAPGFWIGNVIVMAGVPSIMQAMLDEVAPKLKIGVPMLSETVRADAREGDIGMQLRPILRLRSAAIRSSIPSTGPTRMWCCAPTMHINSRKPSVRSRRCWSECGGHNHVAEARPLTAKPLGSANEIKVLFQNSQLVSNNCPINVYGQAWTSTIENRAHARVPPA
jgi:molybdopterin-biosynthesis enzyme MoeA-like protein